MAERNVDQLTELHSKMIAHLAGQGKNDELDPQLVEMLEKLKCSDQRKELDALLGKINETLIDIDSVKHTFDRDDKVQIEIEECKDRIVEIRDHIIECMEQHAEMCLMVKDMREFVKELKDLKIEISKVSEVTKIPPIATLGVLLIVGGGVGMCKGLFIKSVIVAPGPQIGLIVSGAVVALGTILLIVGGVSWCYVSWRRNRTTRKQLLGGIQKVCKDLKDKKILAQLMTFKDQFNVQREALKKNLNYEFCTDLNIIMKCYKSYKKSLEKALNDPSNIFTEDQLSDLLASQATFPLMEKFKLSETDAIKLILLMDQHVTRK